MAIEFKMIIFGQPGVILNVYLGLYMAIYWKETFLWSSRLQDLMFSDTYNQKILLQKNKSDLE